MAEFEIEPRSPLRIWRLVRESYASCWSFRRELALLAWPALLVSVVQAVMNARNISLKLPETVGGTLADLVVFLGFGLVLLPLLGGAYRLFLTGETGRADLSWRREEWLVLGAMIRLGGIGVFAILAASAAGWGLISLILEGIQAIPAAKALFASDTAIDVLSVVVVLPLMVASFAFIYRFVFVVPAAALGRPMALAEARKPLRGSALKLCLAGVAAMLPMTALYVICDVFSGVAALPIGADMNVAPPFGPYVAVSIAGSFFGIIGSLLNTGVVASAWRTLGGGVRRASPEIPAGAGQERG